MAILQASASLSLGFRVLQGFNGLMVYGLQSAEQVSTDAAGCHRRYYCTSARQRRLSHESPSRAFPTREAKCSDSWALEAKRGVWASPTFPTLCFFGGREAPSEIRETESAQHTAYIRKHMLFGVSLLAAARICATTAAIQHGGETEIAEQGQQCVMSQAPNTGYLTLLIRSRSTS